MFVISSGVLLGSLAHSTCPSLDLLLSLALGFCLGKCWERHRGGKDGWVVKSPERQADGWANRQPVFCRLVEGPLKHQMLEVFPEPLQYSLELGLPAQLQPCGLLCLWSSGSGCQPLHSRSIQSLQTRIIIYVPISKQSYY